MTQLLRSAAEGTSRVTCYLVAVAIALSVMVFGGGHPHAGAGPAGFDGGGQSLIDVAAEPAIGTVAYESQLDPGRGDAASVGLAPAGAFGNYAKCVLGIGIPSGIALYFVASVGTRAAFQMLKGHTPPGGPMGVVAKRYASKVWNACGRFIRS